MATVNLRAQSTGVSLTPTGRQPMPSMRSMSSLKHKQTFNYWLIDKVFNSFHPISSDVCNTLIIYFRPHFHLWVPPHECDGHTMSSTTNGDKSSTTTTNATTNTTPSSGADQHINDKPQTTYTIADLGLRPNPLTQQTIIGPVSHCIARTHPLLTCLATPADPLDILAKTNWMDVSDPVVGHTRGYARTDCRTPDRP